LVVNARLVHWACALSAASIRCATWGVRAGGFAARAQHTGLAWSTSAAFPPAPIGTTGFAITGGCAARHGDIKQRRWVGRPCVPDNPIGCIGLGGKLCVARPPGKAPGGRIGTAARGGWQDECLHPLTVVTVDADFLFGVGFKRQQQFHSIIKVCRRDRITSVLGKRLLSPNSMVV